MSNASKKEKVGGRTAATSWNQKQAILSWLEVPTNFKLITGGLQQEMKSVVAGQQLTKTAAYQQLAESVNQKCSTNWDGHMAMCRYRALYDTYVKTKRALLDVSGEKFCISEQDLKRGINTIEKKLNDCCTDFNRWDALFGERQNVVPSYVLEPELSASDKQIPCVNSNFVSLACGINTSNLSEDYELVSEMPVTAPPMPLPSKKTPNVVILNPSPTTPSTTGSGSVDDVAEDQSENQISKKPRQKLSLVDAYVRIEREKMEVEREATKASNGVDTVEHKCSLIRDLAAQGKSPEEVKDYLKLLGL